MTLANEVTLSQNEVKRINQRYLKARGDAVERMAAMSVMGSTIEELKRENAKLRAELKKQRKYTKSALEYAEMMDDADTATNVELEQLRAELAAIKPDWKDVLKWVKWRARDKDGRLWNYSNEPSKPGDWGWTQEGGMADIASACQNWRDTLERRPEDK